MRVIITTNLAHLQPRLHSSRDQHATRSTSTAQTYILDVTSRLGPNFVHSCKGDSDMGSDISCFLMGFSFVWVHIAQVHWADDGQSRHPDHMSHIAATAQKFQSLTSKQRDIDRCKSSKLHALRDEKLDGERKSRCQTETATDITFAALPFDVIYWLAHSISDSGGDIECNQRHHRCCGSNQV